MTITIDVCQIVGLGKVNHQWKLNQQHFLEEEIFKGVPDIYAYEIGTEIYQWLLILQSCNLDSDFVNFKNLNIIAKIAIFGFHQLKVRIKEHLIKTWTLSFTAKFGNKWIVHMFLKTSELIRFVLRIMCKKH